MNNYTSIPQINFECQNFTFLQNYAKDEFKFQEPDFILQEQFDKHKDRCNIEIVTIIDKDGVEEDVRISIIENHILSFSVREGQIQDLKAINIEFAFMKVIKDPQGAKMGIGLMRNEIQFQIIVYGYKHKQQQISKMIKQLNKYVLRNETLKTYRVIRKLGEGGQARVYKVVKLNPQCQCHINEAKCELKHQSYAVKILDVTNFKTELEIQQFISKINVMHRLFNCGNAIKIIKIFANRNFLNIFLEYQQGGTLYDLIIKNQLKGKKFTKEEQKLISIQLLASVDYFQIKGIIHRDLKSQNILLHSTEPGMFDIRIADFGYSILLENVNDPIGVQVCGTPGFIPPEILKKSSYCRNSDMFSVGCLIYLVATGGPIFNGQTISQLLDQNKKCEIDYINQKLTKVSGNLKVLLEKLLLEDPNERPSAIMALQFKWFKSFRTPIVKCLLQNEPNRTIFINDQFNLIYQNITFANTTHNNKPQDNQEVFKSQIQNPTNAKIDYFKVILEHLKIMKEPQQFYSPLEEEKIDIEFQNKCFIIQKSIILNLQKSLNPNSFLIGKKSYKINSQQEIAFVGQQENKSLNRDQIQTFDSLVIESEHASGKGLPYEFCEIPNLIDIKDHRDYSQKSISLSEVNDFLLN